MRTQQIERELRAVIHRHAEDAIAGTDTVGEHERFRQHLETDSKGTGRNRWAVAVAAASVVLAAVGGWALGALPDDGGPRPAGPSTGMSDTEIAQAFVEAYGAGDVVQAATYLAPGHEPYEGWETYVARNVAWHAIFLFETCEVANESSFGTGVLCPFDLHVMHSDAVGEGPFTGNTFTVYVKDGAITQADDQMPFETNGQSEYVESVTAWVERHYPQEWAFLSLDEPDVAGPERPRWLRMWDRALDAYLEAETGGGE
jgi:hypothetical protein